MTPPNAPWINFLRKYGPSAANDNMYDETIEQSRKRAGVQPLVLPTPFLEEAFQCLTAPVPRSVILTGTAGDGKTYYCRQLWQRLGGAVDDWADDAKSSQGMYVLHWEGRTISIIKDLSEVEKSIAKTTLAKVSKDLASGNAERLYVIAANHGQLYEQWLPLLGALPAARETWTCIEDQLVDGNTSSSIPLRLFDLSRRPAAESMKAVLTQILEHPHWEHCGSCALFDGQVRCPIQENRRRLLGANGDSVFRKRLIELMELSTQNNQHIPVRQQLMLVANILLGHADSRDHLMSCGEIEQIVESGSYWKATPYGNAVGENLSPRKRRNREIFERLSRLGLGQETSNRIDRLLTLGADDPDLQGDYEALLGGDVAYGSTRPWKTARDRYLEDGHFEYDGSGDGLVTFKSQLRLQRQRLFFSMPDAMSEKYDVWALTVYQNARKFLGAIESLHSGGPVPVDLVKHLVKGLNRVFIGALVEVNDSLVLATAGSNSQARTNLLYEAEVSVRKSRGEFVTLVPRTDGGISLRVQLRESDPPPIDLPLTALRFEFLSRVADGALPSSFSLECYEDILAYKSRVLAALERRREIEEEPGDQDLTLRFIDILPDGSVRPHQVEVRAP